MTGRKGGGDHPGDTGQIRGNLYNGAGEKSLDETCNLPLLSLAYFQQQDAARPQLTRRLPA